MGYINPEWLNQDEHARALKAADKYDNYSEAVDREIQEACLDAGVKTADIPVDVDGYVTGVHLRNLGVSYALYALFSGHWGIRDSSSDIYLDKSNRYRDEWRDRKRKLTAAKIIGNEDCVTSVSARARASTVPMQ